MKPQFKHINLSFCILAMALILFSCVSKLVGQSPKESVLNPTLFNMVKQNQQSYYSQFNPQKEIVAARGMASKQYKNDNGSITFIADSKPLHYKEGNIWKEIKTDIILNTGKERTIYGFCNLTNASKTYYPNLFNEGVKVDLTNKTSIGWQKTQMAWVDKNNQIIQYTITDANQSTAKLYVNSLTYTDVFNGIDATFIQGEESRELFYIINNPDALKNKPANAAYLVFYETMLLPEGYYADGVIDRKGEQIQEIIIYDAEGNPSLGYSPIFYYDSNLKEGDKPEKGSYTLNHSGKNVVIGIQIPIKWLSNPDRKYPIIIDPTTYYNYSTTKTCGSVDNTGYVWYTGIFYTNDFMLGLAYNTDYILKWVQGWAEFDLSTLDPDDILSDADIMLYQFGYGNDYAGSMIDCDVTKLTTRPSSYVVSGYGNTTLYNNIKDGTSYCSHDFTTAASSGWKTISEIGSSSTALNDIASAAGGTFSVGFDIVNSGTSSSGTNYIDIYNWSSSNRPKLILTICTPPSGFTAGDDQIICSSTATMAATLGTGVSGEWTRISGTGSITSATSATTTITGITGTSIFRWTVTSSGGCADYDEVTILNNSPTTANAGSNATTCTSQYSLSGNAPGTGCTGKWSDQTSSGTATFANSTLYNTTVSTLKSGVNTLRWTITKGSCTSSDDVEITYSALPTATITTPATATVTVCTNSQDLRATDPSPATGLWTLSSGGGTITNAYSHNTASISGLSVGTNIIYWTVTGSGTGCVSQDNVTITNNTPVTANAGPDQTISGSSTTMSANNPPSGQTGTWSWVGTPTATINAPGTNYNNTISGLTTNTYTVRWSITSGACPASTDDVTITCSLAEAGLIITDNLTNDGGSFYHTDDPNFFIMRGTDKYINGENGKYLNAKV